MGNLQSSAPLSRGGGGGGTKSRNKRPSATGTRDWLMGTATRALRKPVASSSVAPATGAAVKEAAAGHVTVTSRDLRRQQTPPTRHGGSDHHADEQQQQQQQHRQERRHRRLRRSVDDESASSTEERSDSSVFVDTLTSPQSVYSDARDEPDDDGTASIMVVNGGETLGGSTGRTAVGRQAFTIVKHRRVELNPTKIQSNAANGEHARILYINCTCITLYVII